MKERFALNLLLDAETIKAFRKYCIDHNTTMSNYLKIVVQKTAKKYQTQNTT